MTLSAKLQERLDAQRQAKEQPRQKPANPFLLSGAALGLSIGISAFTFGAQTPSNTLPATPDWRARVSQATAEGLRQPAPKPAVEDLISSRKDYTNYMLEGRSEAVARCLATENMIREQFHYSSADGAFTPERERELVRKHRKQNNNCQEPVVQEIPPAVNIHDVKPGARCNPYVNGVYIGSLCGDHDAFAEKAERVSRSQETEAERVRGQALSYAAQKMLERCDRDWLPSTCAKMRAELGAN